MVGRTPEYLGKKVQARARLIWSTAQASALLRPLRGQKHQGGVGRMLSIDKSRLSPRAASWCP